MPLPLSDVEPSEEADAGEESAAEEPACGALVLVEPSLPLPEVEPSEAADAGEEPAEEEPADGAPVLVEPSPVRLPEPPSAGDIPD
jgi:hypothetical protein